MSSDGFFSQYPEFDHDPTAPLVAEFQRLSLQRGWKAGGKKYRQSRQKCFAQEFEHHYGHASDKLAGWQALCADLYVSPTPSSIKQCKKALSRISVNLVDLVDSHRTGEKVKLFPSKNALRNYSINHNKIFSKRQAKADGYVCALLIQMF